MLAIGAFAANGGQNPADHPEGGKGGEQEDGTLHIHL